MTLRTNSVDSPDMLVLNDRTGVLSVLSGVCPKFALNSGHLRPELTGTLLLYGEKAEKSLI